MAYIVLTYIILYYYSGCVGGNNLDDIDNLDTVVTQRTGNIMFQYNWCMNDNEYFIHVS